MLMATKRRIGVAKKRRNGRNREMACSKIGGMAAKAIGWRRGNESWLS